MITTVQTESRSSAATADVTAHTSYDDLEAEQLRRLGWSARIEAATLLLLLCVAMPLKYWAHWPQGVRVMGLVHGVAFLAYAWTVIETVAGGGWTVREIARLVVGAILPFGGLLTPRWLGSRAARDAHSSAQRML